MEQPVRLHVGFDLLQLIMEHPCVHPGIVISVAQPWSTSKGIQRVAKPLQRLGMLLGLPCAQNISLMQQGAVVAHLDKANRNSGLWLKRTPGVANHAPFCAAVDIVQGDDANGDQGRSFFAQCGREQVCWLLLPPLRHGENQDAASVDWPEDQCLLQSGGSGECASEHPRFKAEDSTTVRARLA